MSESAGSAGILDGIKVLEVGTFVFGPAAATVMSDFGARVIKVEHPATGDPYRLLHRMPPMPACDRVYCFLVVGRNKRSIALDLSKAEGGLVLERLVRWSDVFLTNFHPSVLAKLHLTYDSLAERNPRLVYAHATGYGEAGAEVEKPGFDATAWWARSGLMDAVRQPGADPALSMPAMGDRPSAMSLFGGVMLALYQRERTGKGTKVSTSLMANGAWANACLIQSVVLGAKPFAVPSRMETLNAVVNLYPTRDDRWVFLALISEDRDWRGLTEALEHPELREQPHFATTADRRVHAQELTRILDHEFRRHDLAEWRQRLERHDVTFGVVARTDEVVHDAQMEANGVFVEVDDGRGGSFRSVDSPIRIAGQTKVRPRIAPAIGEHTAEILAEQGFDPAAIDRLRASGAIPGPASGAAQPR